MKRTTPRRKSATRCDYSNRCPRRPTVTVSETERLCKTHAKWIADKLVGDFVKTRDGCCWNCGARDKGLQWAHIISRSALHIRWNPLNAVSLDAGCHQRFTLNPATWAVWTEEHAPGLWARLVAIEAAGQASGESVDLAAIINEYRGRAAA